MRTSALSVRRTVFLEPSHNIEFQYMQEMKYREESPEAKLQCQILYSLCLLLKQVKPTYSSHISARFILTAIKNRTPREAVDLGCYRGGVSGQW